MTLMHNCHATYEYMTLGGNSKRKPITVHIKPLGKSDTHTKSNFIKCIEKNGSFAIVGITVADMR